MEGIEKAQDAAKKEKKEKKGDKQNKIHSTRKSKQKLDHELKRYDIDNDDMKSDTIKRKEWFALAQGLRESQRFRKSNKVLKKFKLLFPKDKKLYFINSLIGGNYLDMGKYKKAYKFFKKALTLNPEHESSSLGAYLSLVEMEEYSMAIDELEGFLLHYPAKLYKVTLEELLSDLKEGFALEFEERIKYLANKNEVEISTDTEEVPPTAN